MGLVWPLEYDESGNRLYDIRLLQSGGSAKIDVRQVVRGMECVEVIQQDGDRVRWTNHRPARKHGPKSNRFVGVSDRRELIALSHLETLLPAPRLNVPRSP